MTVRLCVFVIRMAGGDGSGDLSFDEFCEIQKKMKTR